MRTTGYVLGAFGIAAALAFARDVADPAAVPGRPVPLSVESMRVMADRTCERPPGYVFGTLQRVRDMVVEAGFTPDKVVVCKIHGDGHGTSKRDTAAPGDRYVAGRVGLVWDDDASLEVGRVAPEVAALDFVLPSGKVVKAEVHGEVFLCFVPEKTAALRIRAYDAGGRLLRDDMI
ncbi:hypothetical protein [Lentzea sp. NPDC003310]|uniref:hypothetical protein n=1 Tax=Lentzea sp. NPDC003310 TaxID=3154447 RepID=UPI0033B83917